MNRALHKFTDEERAEQEAMIRRILHEVQHIELEPEPRRIPWGVLAYAASLCVVVAWMIAEGVF